LEANSTYNPGYRLSINDGALYTNSRFVNLRYGWNIGDDIESVSFSNDGGFGPEGNTTGWLPINAGDPMYQDWELTTYGHWLLPRTVYVKFRDGSGQQYGPFQDDIIYDEQAPTCTNVQILSETTRTTEGEAGQVIVRAQVDDDNSGVVKLHLSNSADFAEYTEVNVTGSTVAATWTLQPSGQVYVRSVDRAGNTSTIQSAQGEIENGPFKIMLPLILK
jgi:hypothetical protein